MSGRKPQDKNEANQWWYWRLIQITKHQHVSEIFKFSADFKPLFSYLLVNEYSLFSHWISPQPIRKWVWDPFSHWQKEEAFQLATEEEGRDGSHQVGEAARDARRLWSPRRRAGEGKATCDACHRWGKCSALDPTDWTGGVGCGCTVCCPPPKKKNMKHQPPMV